MSPGAITTEFRASQLSIPAQVAVNPLVHSSAPQTQLCDLDCVAHFSLDDCIWQ